MWCSWVRHFALTHSATLQPSAECYTCKLFPVADDHSTLERLPFLEDPLGTQRLSFISTEGSEIDSDYSSASSVVHVSDEQKNLEYVNFYFCNLRSRWNRERDREGRNTRSPSSLFIRLLRISHLLYPLAVYTCYTGYLA